MMANEMDVEYDVAKRKVKITMTRRDSWGRVKETKQYTMSRAAFDRSLKKIGVVAPLPDSVQMRMKS